MILMTEHTRTLTGDLVEVECRPAITVKGISAPVEVFRLARVRSAIDADGGRPRRPFVGRKSELAQFRGIIEA
jgi:class 3 adenylate cyclase